MKVSYGRLLRTFAVTLFSLSLAGEVLASPLSDAYEGMIAAALAKPVPAEKIDALGGFASVAGSVDAETAKEINPEFTAALTTIYNEAQANAALHPALKKMLTSASATPILDAGQKATVAQWMGGLKDAAPAAVAAAPAGAAGLSSQAKTLDAGAMQQLATADSVFLSKIKALDQEGDDGKRFEGIYGLLHEAQGKAFGAEVQEVFGKLLVKGFNEAMEVHSYLQQVLKEVVTNKTPLLAPAQIEYVTKEMMPRVKGGAPDAKDGDKKDGAKAGEKKGGKGKGGKGKKGKGGKGKKGKGGKGAVAAMVDLNKDGKDDRDADGDGKVSAAEAKAFVDANKDGKDDRDTDGDGKVSAAEAKAYADAHKTEKKSGGKGGKGKKGKGGKKGGKKGKGGKNKKPAAVAAAAPMVDADHDGKPDAPAVTGDTHEAAK